MSINWVMLDAKTQSFVPLPEERVLITSPARTSLSLKPHSSAPSQQPLPLICNDGKAILTTQRFIYLPVSRTAEFQSLAAPILSLQDTRVVAPFFGANAWEAMLLPTSGGGFSPQTHFMQLRLTFREGGAFDFHSKFEQIKERVGQATEMARERQNGGEGPQPTNGSLLVDLEQLPAYDGPSTGSLVSTSNAETSATLPSATTFPNEKAIPPVSATDALANTERTNPSSPILHQPSAIRPQAQQLSTESQAAVASDSVTVLDDDCSIGSPLPNEPPPGYEEAQSHSVACGLEQRLRENDANDS